MDDKTILFSILLGVFSAPISFIKKPRFFWGSAGFDPISFFWMISFFLFGPLGALISSFIGSISTFFFSREKTPLLGAVLKFTGTLIVWLTFYCMLRKSPNMFCSALYFKDIAIIVPFLILAAIVRCIVEIPACFFAIPYYLSKITEKTVSSHMMVEKFGGTTKFFLTMIGLNFWLTFLDVVIPWLIVYPTGIYDRFAVW